jgi:hypothetical protein
MTRRRCAAAGAALLVMSVALLAQKQTDWAPTANNPDIQYRVQVFERSKACDLEYRDQKQGSGYTTFDVGVDYKSTELDSSNQPKTKSETHHIVTAPGHTASARIVECMAVVSARVSVVQRQ